MGSHNDFPEVIDYPKLRRLNLFEEIDYIYNFTFYLCSVAIVPLRVHAV